MKFSLNLESTMVMRWIVILIGISVFGLGVLLFPSFRMLATSIDHEIMSEFPTFGTKLVWLPYVFLIGLYAMEIPFFYAIWQTLHLLYYIDSNQAFSVLSVDALKSIKYSAIAIVMLYVIGILPSIYLVAEFSDAPGIMLIGMAIVLAPIVVATLSAVLQRLLQEAIAIKSENDFTV